MLRLGFFLGFFVGAAAGAGFAQQGNTSAESEGRPLDRVKAAATTKFNEAREIAKQEAQAKEQEMMRDFEKATHPAEAGSD